MTFLDLKLIFKIQDPQIPFSKTARKTVELGFLCSMCFTFEQFHARVDAPV